MEGLVPAMPPENFFNSIPQNKRQTKATHFKDCVLSNIIEKSACNNSRPFVVPQSNCKQYRESFFVQTVIDWNQLDNQAVTSKSLSSFKRAIGEAD